jgi:hypothetical protein
MIGGFVNCHRNLKGGTLLAIALHPWGMPEIADRRA